MSKFKNLIKFATFWKSKSEFYVGVSSETRVLTHWKILMTGFLAVTILVLVTSGWIYRDIGRGELFSATGSSTPQSSLLTKEVLDSTVDNFEAKSAAFEQVRKNRAISADPSL
jgi:hypothetical protein